MTSTRPWRRMILHFSHIGLTDGRTFMIPFGWFQSPRLWQPGRLQRAVVYARVVRRRLEWNGLRRREALCLADVRRDEQGADRTVPVRRPRHRVPRLGLRSHLGDETRMTTMDFPLSIINGKTVSDIIRGHRAECIEVGRHAYLAHARGQSVNPDSNFLRFPDKPDCRIIALPAYVGDGFHVAGMKWIASYPRNVEQGFPRASAVLVLNSYDTGYPFAILESSIISAARTAASAVLAADWLAAGGCRTRRVRTL